MIVVRLETVRNSYSIVKADSLKKLLEYVSKAYDEDYLKSMKVLKPIKRNLSKAIDVN